MRQNETPKRLSKRRLTDKLVDLIFNGKTNMTGNAKTLGIGRATAYRYWDDWVESTEAKQVDVEWWAMFTGMKTKSPVKAFEGLTRIKIRKTPQKIEAKAEYNEIVRKELTFNFNELPKIARRKLIEAEELLARAENPIREE